MPPPNPPNAGVGADDGCPKNDVFACPKPVEAVLGAPNVLVGGCDTGVDAPPNPNDVPVCAGILGVDAPKPPKPVVAGLGAPNELVDDWLNEKGVFMGADCMLLFAPNAGVCDEPNAVPVAGCPNAGVPNALVAAGCPNMLPVPAPAAGAGWPNMPVPDGWDALLSLIHI